MYRGKHGPTGVVVYEPAALRPADATRWSCSASCARPCERDELVLHYQPKIDLQHRRGQLGVEALVRWQHPERGLLPPVGVPARSPSGPS